MDTIQKYIEPFSELYEKLDFASFFSAYWYAQKVTQPMDLPILSAALENLKRKWYEEVEINPETVLMDKKDFSKRIKPIKKMVETQFAGTEYVERMKRSVEGMNRMSVSEQLTHFFEGIDMPVGKKEKKALQARNFSAHGLYAGDSIDYEEQFMTSQVYESTLNKYPEDEYMQDGDIVINSTGTGTLGRVGFYRATDNYNSLSIVPDSHVTVIRSSREIHAFYLFAFMKANQSELEKKGEGSTNQKELKPLTLKELYVPVPPYEEQLRIAVSINNAFSLISKLEKSLK